MSIFEKNKRQQKQIFDFLYSKSLKFNKNNVFYEYLWELKFNIVESVVCVFWNTEMIYEWSCVAFMWFFLFNLIL